MIEGEARFPGGTPLDPRIDYAKIVTVHGLPIRRNRATDETLMKHGKRKQNGPRHGDMLTSFFVFEAGFD